jgi:hypothetical protein
MREELKGDYECDECGHAEHNPKDNICPKCGGELCYMMTLQDLVDELNKDNNQLRAENEKLKRLLETDVSIEELCYAYHVVLRKADVFDDIHQFITNLDDKKYYDAMNLLLNVRKQILTEALNEVTK